MKRSYIDNAVWAAFGLSAGILGSIVLAAPWLAPLQDRVVNAMSNVFAAIAAVGGAFLLWRHQLRERESRLKASIVTIFEGLHEDMNIARVTLDFDGSQALLAAHGRETNDPAEIANYLRDNSKFRLYHVEQRAKMALEQLYSIQDAIPGLSKTDIEILLELHQIASEAVRRAPELVNELSESTGDLYLSTKSMSILDHGVSLLAYQLNKLDNGKRNAELYIQNIKQYESVKAAAKSMAPTVRRLGPAPQVAGQD